MFYWLKNEGTAFTKFENFPAGRPELAELLKQYGYEIVRQTGYLQMPKQQLRIQLFKK